MSLQISSDPPEPTPEEIEDCISWLSFHRIWGKLGEKTIAQIASSLYLLRVEASTNIFDQNGTPQGLYLLKWGTVEMYRTSPVGQTHIIYRNAGELFGHISLGMLGETTTCRTGAIAITKSEIWFLSRERFEQLKTEYPEINSAINTLLAQDLAKFQDRIAKEQARIQGLQPYIRPVPIGETIISNSKSSQKLAQQVEQASQDLKPIFLQALPGSGKTFISGIIHEFQPLLKLHPGILALV